MKTKLIQAHFLTGRWWKIFKKYISQADCVHLFCHLPIKDTKYFFS